jgi:hypothetical protein
MPGIRKFQSKGPALFFQSSSSRKLQHLDRSSKESLVRESPRIDAKLPGLQEEGDCRRLGTRRKLGLRNRNRVSFLRRAKGCPFKPQARCPGSLYHSGKKSGRTGSLKKINRRLDSRDRHPFTGLLSHGCVITQLWCPHHAFALPCPATKSRVNSTRFFSLLVLPSSWSGSLEDSNHSEPRFPGRSLALAD